MVQAHECDEDIYAHTYTADKIKLVMVVNILLLHVWPVYLRTIKFIQYILSGYKFFILKKLTTSI